MHGKALVEAQRKNHTQRALNTYNLFIIQHTSDCCKTRAHTYANEAKHNFSVYEHTFSFFAAAAAAAAAVQTDSVKCNTIFLSFNFIFIFARR
jgi:hypothetical protein